MEFYFYTQPYNKEIIARRLRRIGFHFNRKNLCYNLGKFEFSIKFSSDEEGRYQLQGFHLDKVSERGRKSPHFTTFEKVVRALRPHQILDITFRERFPELTKDFQSTE